MLAGNSPMRGATNLMKVEVFEGTPSSTESAGDERPESARCPCSGVTALDELLIELQLEVERPVRLTKPQRSVINPFRPLYGSFSATFKALGSDLISEPARDGFVGIEQDPNIHLTAIITEHAWKSPPARSITSPG